MEQIIKGAVKATDRALNEYFKYLQQFAIIWPITINRTDDQTDAIYFYEVELDVYALNNEDLEFIAGLIKKYPSVLITVMGDSDRIGKLNIEFTAKTECKDEDFDSNKF